MTPDADELVNLYRRKRGSFAEQLDQDNDQYVQASLQLAIRYTDLCMAVATDLQVALLAFTKKVTESIEQNTVTSEKITARAIGSLETTSSISDEQMRLQLAQLVQQSTDVQLAAGQHSLELIETTYQLVTSTADHFIASLQCGILKSGDEEEALRALGILLEFLLGQVPVLGTLVGGYSAIRDIVDSQREAAGATTYLKRLKDYTTAAFYWAASVQIFIDGLAGVESDSEDARLDSAVEKLTQRLGLAA